MQKTFSQFSATLYHWLQHNVILDSIKYLETAKIVGNVEFYMDQRKTLVFYLDFVTHKNITWDKILKVVTLLGMMPRI